MAKEEEKKKPQNMKEPTDYNITSNLWTYMDPHLNQL